MSRKPASLIDVAPFTMASIVICVLVYGVMAAKASGAPKDDGEMWLNILKAYGASWREGVWDGDWV